MPDLEPIYEVFGVRIRAARKRKGLTLQELGAVIGRKAGYYSNIESGRLRVQLHVAERLAEAVGVSLAELTAPSAARARLEALADE